MRLETPQTAFRPGPAAVGKRAALPALWAAWNRGVSAPTIASREHDLALFGRFSWRFKGHMRTCRAILDALQDGTAPIAALASAWDDEQRANGLAWKTRARRRGTLRCFVAMLERDRLVPRGTSIDALPRESVKRGSIAAQIDLAIEQACERGRWRDVAILALAWESGRNVVGIQELRVFDLPLPLVSMRCAHALSRLADRRGPNAWLVHGRNAAEPIAPQTIRGVFLRYGLPPLRSIHLARERRLRELGYPSQTNRALAGEI
jgi:hypothetical protein